MNDDNAQYMLAIFSTGFACGMQHRYECYCSYENILAQYSPRDRVASDLREMWDIVLEFEKSLASCPEEGEDLKSYTVEQLSKDINRWYARKTLAAIR